MSKYLSSARARTARLVSVIVLCLAVFSPLAADDRDKSPPGDAAPKNQAANVTRTIKIYAPSVAVRANPDKAQAARGQGLRPNTAGQFAHLDENGQLTSSPPPGIAGPIPLRVRESDRVPYRSPADPNALLFDSRDIRAVVFGKVDANGSIVLDCIDNADATPFGHKDHAHDAANPKTKASAASSSTEER